MLVSGFAHVQAYTQAYAQTYAKSYAQAHTQTSMQTNTQAKNLEPKTLLLDWKTSLTGLSHQSESSQSKLLDFRLELKLDYYITPYLRIDAIPVLKFQSGTQQTLTATDSADNKILLYNAAITVAPFAYFNLSLGALNQRYLHSNLLIDEIPFPAARLEWTLIPENNNNSENNWNKESKESKESDIRTMGTGQLSLILETAVPTSSSLSTNTKEFETTPSLNSLALNFKLTPQVRQLFQVKLGYFSFSALPGSVAAKSYLLGNTVDKISDTEGEFEYGYQGYEGSLLGRTPMSNSVDIYAGAEYLKNALAPEGLNTAWLTFIGSEIYFGPLVSMDLRSSYFQIEPDATVSYFSSNKFFNTNRVGYSFESFLKFHKEGFRVGLRFTDSEIMYEHPIQTRESAIYLRLETLYAGT